MSEIPENNVRCPTCRAQQVWSDTCRRCKCDLRLLYTAELSYRNSRVRCLNALHAGRADAAAVDAQTCLRIRPDEESRKLLAVCALLDGDWPTAVKLALEHPSEAADQTDTAVRNGV
jgi:hypothetical protein